MNKLEKLRVEIDLIDKNISELIIKRYSLADEIIKVKGNKFPFDPQRENMLLKKVIDYGLEPLIVERIWRQIISSNLARQKKMKIGILDNDKYTIAAYETYFGPYYETCFFSRKEDLFDSLDEKKIDIGFVDKMESFVEENYNDLVCVADYPLTSMFYNKKFSILINKRNWGFTYYVSFIKKIYFRIKPI